MQVTIQVQGMSQLRDRFGKIRSNISRAVTQKPLKFAKLARQRIAEQIASGEYTYYKVGPYKRAGGQGMENAIRAYSNQKGKVIVDIDPAARAGNSGPADYAEAVELGSKHSEAKFYWKKGLQAASIDMKNIIAETAKEIIQ